MSEPKTEIVKFSLALLPRDGARLLEGILPFLDRIEHAATPEIRKQAVDQLRGWLVECAAALRQNDPEPAGIAPKVPCSDCAKQRKELRQEIVKELGARFEKEEETLATRLGRKAARRLLKLFEDPLGH